MSNDTRVTCEDITEEVLQKFQNEGFQLVFKEYVMEHSLSVIPCIETSLPLTVESWSETSKEDFFEVYHESFKDRPGYPGWSMDTWIQWIASSPSFIPEMSFIAFLDQRKVGFIATDVDTEYPDSKGYIVQAGVIPAYRRKGVATKLVVNCLEAFKKDGKKAVMLHVNQNNPNAIDLYEQLGFRTVRIRGTFKR